MNNLKTFLGFKDLHRYGSNINSYDVAKFLAIFFMILDHLGFFIFMDTPELRGLGRMAFPIFFFLIGYSHDNKRSWNLLILGLGVTFYRGMIAGMWEPFDILVTAFFSKMALRFFVRKDMLDDFQLFATYFILLIWHIAILMIFSYGSLGVMFAICGYLKRRENDGQPSKYLNIVMLASIIMDYGLQRLFWEETENFKYIFSCVSVVLLYYFMNFRMVNFTGIKNKLATDVILFVSRNSLMIYWLHYIVLLTLGVFLAPDKFVN